MSKNRKIISLATLMLGLWLCSSAASAGESSKGAYPGAFDRPPASEQPALTKDEQSKLRDELTKTRDRQNSQVKTKEEAPAPGSKKR
jgi:hypothetical protein